MLLKSGNDKYAVYKSCIAFYSLVYQTIVDFVDLSVLVQTTL